MVDLSIYVICTSPKSSTEPVCPSSAAPFPRKWLSLLAQPPLPQAVCSQWLMDVGAGGAGGAGAGRAGPPSSRQDQPCGIIYAPVFPAGSGSCPAETTSLLSFFPQSSPASLSPENMPPKTACTRIFLSSSSPGEPDLSWRNPNSSARYPTTNAPPALTSQPALQAHIPT